MKILFVTASLFFIFISCEHEIKTNLPISNPNLISKIESKEISEIEYTKITDRTQISKQLTEKIKENKPLIAHILVPLCDNLNQGIVPTSPKLGNGLDLRNNLYWGVRHGMKTIFKRNKKWKLVKEIKNPSSNILERVIYQRIFENKAKVILVMDAYRGDRMKVCLEDYFNSLAENKTEILTIDSTKIPIYGNADLIGFNGHNGLMDTEISYEITKQNIRQKDALSISCQSKYYFNERYQEINAYPLVVTTNNLYPGGFIVEGIIEKWAIQKSDELIRQEAGNAYHRVKKCGIKGARRLFQTGWNK